MTMFMSMYVCIDQNIVTEKAMLTVAEAACNLHDHAIALSSSTVVQMLLCQICTTSEQQLHRYLCGVQAQNLESILFGRL